MAVLLVAGVAPAGAAAPHSSLGVCNLPADISGQAPPFGVGPCPGVRPGAYLDIDHQVGCTMNYLFVGYRLDANGNKVQAGRYIGSAGHCAADQGEEKVFEPGHAPVAYDRNGTLGTGDRIGEFAYAVHTGEMDFSLIRLDAGVKASPQMCHFGGPTGLVDPDFTGAPAAIEHFGQGLVFGDTVAARTGIAYLTNAGNDFAATAAIFGDSGSGVQLADGRAFGVLVGITVLGVVITRLQPEVERARQMLGLSSLEIQTAPLL